MSWKKTWTQMSAVQILTFPLEAYVIESPPIFFFRLCNGKNNMPALHICEAQNKIKMKALSSLKSAIQIVIYHYKHNSCRGTISAYHLFPLVFYTVPSPPFFVLIRQSQSWEENTSVNLLKSLHLMRYIGLYFLVLNILVQTSLVLLLATFW